MIGAGYHRKTRRFGAPNQPYKLIPADVLADVQPETKPTSNHNRNLTNG